MFDPLSLYFAMLGTTFARDFSVILLVKLFSRKDKTDLPTLSLLQLTLDYKSVCYEIGMTFSHLEQNYLTVDSLCNICDL